MERELTGSGDAALGEGGTMNTASTSSVCSTAASDGGTSLRTIAMGMAFSNVSSIIAASCCCITNKAPCRTWTMYISFIGGEGEGAYRSILLLLLLLWLLQIR